MSNTRFDLFVGPNNLALLNSLYSKVMGNGIATTGDVTHPFDDELEGLSNKVTLDDSHMGNYLDVMLEGDGVISDTQLLVRGETSFLGAEVSCGVLLGDCGRVCGRRYSACDATAGETSGYA